jgi:DnaJ-class molecular chaperone
MQDYYRILGVSETADVEEIRSAYRRLAREHHPDVTGDPNDDEFKKVRHAYEMLSDEKRRAQQRRRGIHASGEPLRAVSQPWFADEVAIDFPSVDTLVEAIRRSFLEAESFARPIHAEVLLTPREAFHGVNVPLDVPVRQTCVRCGGRGETWMEACAACGGSGEASARHQVELLVPAGVRDGARFRFRITPPFAPPTVVEVRIAIQ